MIRIFESMNSKQIRLKKTRPLCAWNTFFNAMNIRNINCVFNFEQEAVKSNAREKNCNFSEIYLNIIWIFFTLAVYNT